MSLLWEMFTYPFILRAFVVGILVALCAALLGVPLVLKRYSMIGDGLSHVSFGALAIAVALGCAKEDVRAYVLDNEEGHHFCIGGKHKDFSKKVK